MKPDTISLVLVYSLIAMTALIMFGLFFVNVPENNKEMVNVFSTAIITGGFITVITWRFGSSKGSQDKTTALLNPPSDPPTDKPAV
jgi:hypothetical protein